jgi:ubiquinone/menaquinone biosynthesis C-methylase UbiE
MMTKTSKRSTSKKQNHDAEIVLEIHLNQVFTNSASREMYEDIYRQSDISQRESFYIWLLDILDLKPEDKYLDVSCGLAQLVALAQESGVSAHGLDSSFEALLSARKATKRFQLVMGDAQNLPYASNSFTVISNIGSIEHYVDMNKAVGEMFRILVPGGRAFVLVPNTFSLLHNIWTAFKEGRTYIDNQPIQRYAARQEWQQLLEKNGLIVDKIFKYETETPRTWGDLKCYFQHPKLMVRMLLSPFVPLNLAFCFLFLIRKPS